MALNRRQFLAGSAAVAATAAAVGSAAGANAAPRDGRPNILVVIVDEMRAPQWFPTTAALDRMLPNIARIRQQAVSFSRYYAASNACSPARGTMLTGLYSHQTGVMLTSTKSVSTLDPTFPTWGSMLRENGYNTRWYGKWHLSDHADTVPGGMEAYGFDGGTYPSPNGGPGVGLHADPGTASQFIDWLDHGADKGPWCTTVSFLNPHDILYWNWTKNAVKDVLPVFKTLPPNFQTADEIRRTRPSTQTAFIELSQLTFGTPGWDAASTPAWIELQNQYLWYQQQVDAQIGRVLDALHSRPDIAANTIVVFTADHGDYAGSHGMHGKGGAAYEEGIRVPLLVYDPRGIYSGGTASTRDQLVSSVDLAPFLLTLATGNTLWRKDPRYAHLARRADIAEICRNPGAAGRPWVVHATDEFTIEEANIPFNVGPPSHILAVITPTAKLVSYSHWQHGSLRIDTGAQQEFELYDYTTDRGRKELDNTANGNQLQSKITSLLNDHIIPAETSAPVPERFREAQQRGFADYYAHANLMGLFGHSG